MDNRHQQSGKKVVLKFAKRRYDGGTEIALINAIEKKRESAEFAQIQAKYMSTRPEGGAPQPQPQPAPAADQPKPSDRKTRVFQALVMGPLEICVGTVGMLTSLLAIVTFGYTKNPSLSQQSKTVFRDCVRTFFKGWLDTVTGPGKAVHRVFGG